ncbi:hypothetical protein ACT7CT_14820 [Bacillus sanguinis]
MLKKFLLSLPDVLLVCVVLYITYTTTFSFGQMLVISIAIGIIGGLVIRICTDVFTYIRWTIKQRKSLNMLYCY